MDVPRRGGQGLFSTAADVKAGGEHARFARATAAGATIRLPGKLPRQHALVFGYDATWGPILDPATLPRALK
jgi:hypothetical protein